MDDTIFYYLAIVPLLGMLAQLLAWWIRVPSILLLLGFGVLLGFWMNPDDILAQLVGNESSEMLGPKLVFPLVSLAVAVILFEGGLSLRFSELRAAAGGAVVRLCTIGVLVSWFLGGLFAWCVLGLNWQLAVLLGAILVVTGPTVVSPLLRHIRPERSIGAVVKWEGIIIDPIGAILAVLVFEQLPHHGDGHVAMHSPLVGILKTGLIGIGIGCATAWLLTVVVKRYWLADYLHGLAFLASALSVFALSNWLSHESGLVTVTVMGIYLANQKSISIEHVVEFKENLGVFLISSLFIVLGSRLDLAVLGEVGWRGVLFVALMILIVRPVSVLAAMWKSKMSWNEKLFLAFLAPRGIVAAAVVSVFSLRILATGDEDPGFVHDAELLVPATFMLIVGTVAVYGLGAAPLARRLGLADANPQGILFGGASPWIRDLAIILKDAGYSVVLLDTNYHNVAAAKMAGLTAYCKSVLSDFAREEVDLAGVGKFLALTRNDAVNAMAAAEFSHVFSRQNVYLLPARDAGKGERSKVGEVSKGRELFADAWSDDRLQKVYENGYRPKLTRITEEFTFDDFQHEHGKDMMVMVVIEKSGIVIVNTSDVELEPKSGQAVIALVRSEEAASGE